MNRKPEPQPRAHVVFERRFWRKKDGTNFLLFVPGGQ
jgi:hypothetical protein